MRAPSVFLALLLSASTPTSVARAEPSAADVDSARQLLREGNELRAKSELRGALARYQAAHALVGTPITALEVGRTHVLLGELVEGFDALSSVAKIPLKPKESENTASARAEAARLARELDPRIPALRVTASNVPAGAAISVTIDGKSATLGVATKVNPGKHFVLVRAGGAMRSADVTVVEGESREVPVAFDAAPAPAEPLSAAASPTPKSPSPTAPRVDGIEPSRPAWPWIAFGIAGAGALAGTVSGIMTLRGASDLEGRCPGGDCPPSEHDRLKATDRWATVSTISFAVAGAAAAVGVVGLLTTSSRDKTASGALRPMIGLGSIGVGGAF